MIKAIFTSILLIIITLFYYSENNESIDPTGVYIMDTNDSIYDGEIKVTQLDGDEIYLEFFVIKYSSYNSGVLEDTLRYINNEAIYSNHDDFGSCKIKFQFYENKVIAEEFADSKCQLYEFGNGITGNGTFIKQ